jgi:tetratricopeptide (TPR) repeat protein
LKVGAFAYYMPLFDRDLIVIQDLLPEHYPMALHEYTHLVGHQAGMNLPLWLNEGFAELYSTMRPMGGKVVVGRIIPGRLEVAEQGLANLREILNAGRSSQAYNEGSRLGIFYAESWSLVHMLKFSKAYAPHFEAFLDAVGNGEASDHALERIYGKSVESIQEDLQAYVRGNHFYEGVIPGKMERPSSEPVVVPKDPVETALVLAGIEAHGPRRDAAIKAMEELAKANPDNPAPLESLAWTQLTGPNPQLASEPFQRALQAGTRNSFLCFNYAVKLRASIADSDYLAALRRAAEIDPQFSPAQELLAEYALKNHDYAEAVARLHLVKKLGRSQASAYYRALSFATFQIGNQQEAKSAALKAQQYASTAEEHRLADELARYEAGAASSLKPPELPHSPEQ